MDSERDAVSNVNSQSRTDRLREARGDHAALLNSSATLGAQMAVLAVTGFAFWLIAARRFDAETVGLTSALFTIVRIANYCASLGLPVLVARYGAARTARSGVLFSWALLVALGSAALGGLVIAVIASDSFAQPIHEIGAMRGGAVFFFASAGLGVTAILDNRQLGLNMFGSFLTRHVINGLVRIPLILLVPVATTAFWLWLILVAVGPVTALATLIVRRRELGPYRLGAVQDVHEVRNYALVNYASLLLAQAPFVVTPLLVLTTVDPEENAAFHIVWAIAELMFLVPNFLGKALLIEGSESQATLRSQTRIMLIASGTFAVIATAFTIPWALLVPTIYGDAYVESGRYLIALTVATLPFALTATALNVARIRAHTGATLQISLALTLGVVVPAAVLAPGAGAAGVTVAWIVGHCVAAIVALPSLRRLLRTTDRDNTQLDSPLVT